MPHEEIKAVALSNNFDLFDIPKRWYVAYGGSGDRRGQAKPRHADGELNPVGPN